MRIKNKIRNDKSDNDNEYYEAVIMNRRLITY